ncbi:MAG: hypothetical protein ACOYOV_07560 [Bacteroidales bacterium]
MDEIKRIRDFEQAAAVLGTMKILVDDDRFAADADFQLLTVQQILNHFLSLVDLSSLEVYILKPVMASVAAFPATDLSVGDRYFINAGDLFCSIGEWNGASWDVVNTVHGDCFYCFASHNFIVRKADSFEFSAGGNSYQHPNHTGDVTSVGDGVQTIAEKAVTLAKMADMDGRSVLYRKTEGIGIPEYQPLNTLRTDLGITTFRPVLSIVKSLPETLMVKGDRYFISDGGLAFKIAEWNNENWVLSNTAEGDNFYCYLLKSFVVRTKNGYDIALGNSSLSDVMTSDVVNEAMRGSTDGVNMIFTTQNSFTPGSLVTFVNGINERYFTVQSSDTIKFDSPPAADSIILAIYKQL